MEAKIKQLPPKDQETIGYVTIEQLEKFMRRVHKDELQYVTVELMLGSLFPKLYENFNKRMSQEHFAGYQEGLAHSQASVESTEVNE